jgi:3-oxoacyl-[acyl-carrier protein] reductase
MAADDRPRGVVVTGGAQGIGFEIARRFLATGARVAIWDYAPSALAGVRAELGAAPDRLETTQVDVGDFEACVAAASALSFRPSVLVNNAGITRDKSFAKLSPSDFSAVVQTNLTGAFHVTKALLDKFDDVAGAHKRIINIASIVALYGNFGQANYAAAKAGLIGLTKTLARELGRKGFTVNAVAPGFIRTAMTGKMPADVLAQIESRVPTGRLGEPGDVASACLFLASPEASYVNGHVLSVDGGLVL